MLQNFKSGYEVSSKSEIAKSEKNDCVVRAIANAFKVNYDMAHVFVKENFDRKNGKGTFNTNTKLKQLAKKPIELADSFLQLTRVFVEFKDKKSFNHFQAFNNINIDCKTARLHGCILIN